MAQQLYSQVLLFPNRAENLDRFEAYRVRLEHWRPLSEQFQDAFRNAYERGESTILLIHGQQGTGKTLFSRRLQRDFDKARAGQAGKVTDNLWHALAGDPQDGRIIRDATGATTLHSIVAENGWLKTLRERYRNPEHRVRVFICDDAHKAGFLGPWTGLAQEQYLPVVASRSSESLLPVVAQRMVELCRSDFQQSIFILLSVESGIMSTLHREIERSHDGLARLVELPLPDSATKEEIVRQNTNGLNFFSYWYCLDGAGPSGKENVYQVLHEKRGFTDSFQAVDRALKSSVGRTGRPPNQNVVTVCTLGSDPPQAKGFIDSFELPLENDFLGQHVGVWFSGGRGWASALATGRDSETARRAMLVESEFALRWVTLGPRATHLLCTGTTNKEIERLLSVIAFFPSVAKPKDRERVRKEAETLDAYLSTLDPVVTGSQKFHDDFKALGQRRSAVYEPALRNRFPKYSVGFQVYSRLRPDVIVQEYRPCAVSTATPGTSDAITKAIQRTGHSIEFTSFLDEEMRGLGDYLIGKVRAYAEMLESV